MKALTVFYDAHCGLCSEVKTWLGGQPCFVPLHFEPFDTRHAGELFPQIENFHPEREILVLADDGAFYRGADAWIVCLWATRRFRQWSFRLATPGLRPLAARICHFVSRNRLRLSDLLRLRSDAEIQKLLINREELTPVCQLPPKLP